MKIPILWRRPPTLHLMNKILNSTRPLDKCLFFPGSVLERETDWKAIEIDADRYCNYGISYEGFQRDCCGSKSGRRVYLLVQLAADRLLYDRREVGHQIQIR